MSLTNEQITAKNFKTFYEGIKPYLGGGGSGGEGLSQSDIQAIIEEARKPEIHSAASHNGIFRGKDLTDIYDIEDICDMISDGTFEDLYIGDYFDVDISTTYTANETVRCVLAGFDMYMNCGDADGVGALTQHHAVIVPKNAFTATAAMNSSATFSGGYIGSNMHTNILPVYANALNSALDDHVITCRKLLSNAIGNNASMAGAGRTGSTSGWAWTNVNLCLMNEVNVSGTTVISSSFYDVGIDDFQYPLFLFDRTARICKCGGTSDCDSSNKNSWWLSCLSNSVYPGSVTSIGRIGWDAPNETFGVRPSFLIG